MTIQPSYPNLHYYVLNYSLICHYGVDLFFSGLSAEKKKVPPENLWVNIPIYIL